MESALASDEDDELAEAEATTGLHLILLSLQTANTLLQHTAH